MNGRDDGTWRLLGQPHWPLDGTDIFEALGQKARALLAVLIVAHDPPPREELAAILWPEAELSRARHNLRQALLTIRRELGKAHAHLLHADADHIRFDPGQLAIDIHRFAEIEGGAPTSPEEVMDLCRGPLLAGFELRTESFDRLIERWRQSFSKRVTAVLDGCIAEALEAGDSRLTDALGRRRVLFSGQAPADDRHPPGAGRHRPGTHVKSAQRHRWLLALLTGFALATIVIVGTFSISGTFRAFLRQTFVGEALDIPRIAVRPFDSINDTEAEQGLAGGVTIGVTYALYAITARELFVVTTPPNSLPSSDLDDLEYARSLGVRYLITGALERDNSVVRVFVRCLDTDTGADVWQSRFDRDVTEAFRLQDEITLRILRGLEIDLSSAERNRIQYLDDTEDLNAWLLAANGVRNLIKLDPSHLEEARESYRQALEIDPDYTSARRGLAWYALLNVRFGTSKDPVKDLQEARNQINVILRHRPDDGMSRALEGLLLLLEDKWDAALESGTEATRLLPGSADVWAALAHSYTFVGEHELALGAIDRAMSLSPGHPEFYDWIKARALRLSGDHGEAIDLLTTGLEENDLTLVQLVELATALSAAGRVEDAQLIATRIRRVSPDFSASNWVLHPTMQDPDDQSREFELLSRAGL